MGGKSYVVRLQIKITASDKKVTLEITTEQPSGILFAEIKIDQTPETGGEATPATLPGSMTSQYPLDNQQKATFSQALEKSLNPHLQILGGLFKAQTFSAKRIFLDQLLANGADIRLLEAGAREIGFSCPEMDLVNIDLNNPVSAFLVAFHPQPPVHLLYCDFINAFEKSRNLNLETWTPIAKSSLLVLLQSGEGKRYLNDLIDLYVISENKGAIQLLKDLINWGKRRLEIPAAEPPPPSADCLSTISSQNGNVAAALEAALEFLRFYDFICIADLLD